MFHGHSATQTTGSIYLRKIQAETRELEGIDRGQNVMVTGLWERK